MDSTSVALLEGQLTWLTHIIGAILRGRLNQSSIDTQVPGIGSDVADLFSNIGTADHRAKLDICTVC